MSDAQSKVKWKTYSKLKLVLPDAKKAIVSDKIFALVQVSEEGYVPSVVSLRSTIGSFLVAAVVPAVDLQTLEVDPKVVRFYVSRVVKQTDLHT